ncbi:MAG: hypothetical protein RJA22_1918 [Verrucomicrobiota bacterium]|jgi:4-hydroxybenzoate polyprenyltransferase
MPSPEKNERDLFFVVKISSAVGMGTLAGFLYSLKEVHPNLRIEVGFGAVLTFLLTAAASWFFCAVMARADVESDTLAGRDEVQRRFFKRLVIVFGTLCGVGTVVAFARSLKNVGAQGRMEVLIGTLLAVVVLACGGWLIHRAMRFFDEQDRLTLEAQRESEDEDEDA